jgi:hypothetical protein
LSTAGEQAQYDRAVGALRALAATYSARIARTEPHADAARLRAERGKVVTQQRALDPADHDAIARILTETPSLMHELRSSPP